MIYATSVDLQSYVTPEWLAELDNDAINAHLADSSALIDSYVGQVKKLPLTVGNRALARCCCVIARWQLILHRGINTSSNYSTYENEYMAQLQWLDLVAKGRVQLDGVVDSSVSHDTSPSTGLMVFTGKKARWY